MRIWNYSTKQCEQFKQFNDEPLCVAMHPNGVTITITTTITPTSTTRRLHAPELDAASTESMNGL